MKLVHATQHEDKYTVSVGCSVVATGQCQGSIELVTVQAKGRNDARTKVGESYGINPSLLTATVSTGAASPVSPAGPGRYRSLTAANGNNYVVTRPGTPDAQLEEIPVGEDPNIYARQLQVRDSYQQWLTENPGVAHYPDEQKNNMFLNSHRGMFSGLDDGQIFEGIDLSGPSGSTPPSQIGVSHFGIRNVAGQVTHIGLPGSTRVYTKQEWDGLTAQLPDDYEVTDFQTTTGEPIITADGGLRSLSGAPIGETMLQPTELGDGTVNLVLNPSNQQLLGISGGSTGHVPLTSQELQELQQKASTHDVQVTDNAIVLTSSEHSETITYDSRKGTITTIREQPNHVTEIVEHRNGMVIQIAHNGARTGTSGLTADDRITISSPNSQPYQLTGTEYSAHLNNFAGNEELGLAVLSELTRAGFTGGGTTSHQGNVITYTQDGEKIEVIKKENTQAGGSSITHYNSDNQEIRRVAGNGDVTTYEYNSDGSGTRTVVDANGALREIGHTGGGNTHLVKRNDDGSFSLSGDNSFTVQANRQNGFYEITAPNGKTFFFQDGLVFDTFRETINGDNVDIDKLGLTDAQVEELKQLLNLYRQGQDETRGENQRARGSLTAESTANFVRGVKYATSSRFTGVGGFSSFFFEDDELSAWSSNVEQFFAETYLGTEYWASAICSEYGDAPPEGLSFVNIPGGLAKLAAFVEGTRSGLAFDENGLPFYIYKFEISIQNGEYDEDPYALDKLRFNVELRGDRNIEIYSSQWQIGKGEQFKRVGRSSVVQDSRNFYSQICIRFEDTPPRWGIEDGLLCNNIVETVAPPSPAGQGDIPPGQPGPGIIGGSGGSGGGAPATPSLVDF